MSLPAVYFDHIGLCQKYGLRHPYSAINAIKLAVWFAFKRNSRNQFMFGTVHTVFAFISTVFYHIVLHVLRNKKMKIINKIRFRT